MDHITNPNAATNKVSAHFQSLGAKPGATNTATVNLVTGKVSFPLNLLSLAGRGDLDFNLSIIYNSNVRQIVDTWNFEAPTSLLGLGWTFIQDQIVRNTRGTGSTLDDTYFLASGGTVLPLTKTGADSEGEIYESEMQQFWKIRYVIAREMWVVTKEDGTRYYYGGGVLEDALKNKASTSEAIEWGVKWGNWIGPSKETKGQEQFPVAWNLTRIQNTWKDQVSFRYEQVRQSVGDGGLKYTQACHLKEIIGATGEKIVCAYGNKDPEEYEKLHASKDGGSDAYQDRLERAFLDNLELFNEIGHKLSRIAFIYSFLGTGEMKKRILKGISHTNATGRPYSPTRLFEYYGENAPEDKVAVTITDSGQIFHQETGALYGALKSVTTPEGAKISYRYSEISIPSARRDLEITRPENDHPDWHYPRIYWGVDYVVVVWRGARSRLGKIHLSAYQWQGQWIPADLGTLSVKDTTGVVPAENDYTIEDNIQIAVSADFFAIVTPDQVQSVHLFSKSKLQIGKWHTLSLQISIEHFLMVSGDGFIALLDKSNGKLYRFTRDGDSWRNDQETLKVGSGTVFGLAARNNYIFSVTAVPDNSFNPELRLYFLNPEANWGVTRSTTEHFFSKQREGWGGSNSGIRDIILHASDAFVTLQVSNHESANSISWTSSGSSDDDYKHFVCKWNEAFSLIDTQQLGSQFQIRDPDQKHSLRLTVVADTVSIDELHGPSGEKHAHQYLGTGWKTKIFTNDSLQNNYIGLNSFSTTQDGNAQFWEFNPNTVEWEKHIPPYKDGNLTLWEKVWQVFFDIEWILTLPLAEVGFLIDIGALGLDFLISNLHEQGVSIDRQGRFFTGDNTVYYKTTTGSWREIGKLLSDEERTDRLIDSSNFPFYRKYQRKSLAFQSTQDAQDFIAFVVKHDQYTTFSSGGEIPTAPDRNPGFPKYISSIQLLKNGRLAGQVITLAEGESVKRSADDETSIVGHNSFVAYKGGESLRQATSLTLHQVINDDLKGVLKDHVVSRVTVNDGYEDTHTHYVYDTTEAQFASTGVNALYNRVTTIFSGNSVIAVKRNGYSESYFYVGSSSPLYQPPTNAAQYPSLMRTLPYYTKVFDGSGTEVAVTNQHWQVFETSFIHNRKGYYLRPVRTENTVNGVKTVSELSYQHRDRLGAGLPDKMTTYNYDVSGKEERIESSYTYGWEVYPELLAQHIISPVVRSETRVNGIPTGTSVTSWQGFPIPFTLTPGSGLPPELHGDNWQITARDKISASASMVYPPGSSENAWQAAIKPLTLKTDYSGKLLFDYEGSASVDQGQISIAQLEVWLDGRKIWNDDTLRSQSSGDGRLDLPRGHGPLEWRVNCRARVFADPTGRFANRVNVGISISSIRIEVEANGHWAPARTFQAKNAAAYPFNYAPDAANKDWLQASAIVRRDLTHGIVTETQGIDGTTHAIILDTGGRFPVATFINASVEGHEAGYYGFEDYENTALSQLIGTRQKESAFTGTTALSGTQAQIMSTSFRPRSSSTPYVVSAWFKCRIGGKGGKIGFGANFKTISSSDPDWRYVEFVSSSVVASQKPFASCDGEIDNFRFGPVEAPFSATIYDPAYKMETAKLGTNGEVNRYFYDDLQRPVFVTGADGQIVQLHSQQYSRDGDDSFHPGDPNQTLFVRPRNGGEYYANFQILTAIKGSPQFTNLSGRSYGLRFKTILSGPNPLFEPSRDAYEIEMGNTNLVVCISSLIRTNDDRMRGTIDVSTQKRTPKTFPVSFASPGEARCYVVMLIVIDKTIAFFLNNTLIFCEAFSDFRSGTLSITTGSQAIIDFMDIAVFYDPVINLSYADGLGRSLQTQSLDDNATGVIVTQTLYDGWGHPAVQTRPMRSQGVILRYRDDVVSTFDWTSGEMAGAISDHYYRPAASPGQDHLFPYIRTLREPNPLARVIEIGASGVEFKAGSPYSVKTDFRRTEDAAALLTGLGLTNKQEHFTSVTTWNPLDKTKGAPTTKVLDAQRNIVALRHGTGNNAVLSTRQVEYKAEGTRDLTTYTPNFHRPPNGDASKQHPLIAKTSFLGRTQSRQDCDRGVRQFIYDRAGRLRFRLDAVGAAETPNRILYWKYDALGRIVEDGFVLQGWNEAQLQNYADEQPSWPTLQVTWRNRYSYDLLPNNDATNVKGRLHQVIARDDAGKQIRESFLYDAYGNVSAKQLQVEAYDNTLRTTKYEYDKLGNVVKIIYPHDSAGPIGLEVNYYYNVLGKLGSIGTANQPSCYAAYEYNIDGSLKTEWLNNKALRRDFSYDFQGRLLEIKDKIVANYNEDALFSEVLSYRDAAGNFKDGNVIQATFAGKALGSEHTYAYEYDEHGRLTAAKVATQADWNVEGITFDANGNITNLKNGPVPNEYLYKPGTNQLATRRTSGAEVGYLYDASGYLTRKLSDAAGSDSKFQELERLLTSAANGDESMWQRADQESWSLLLRGTNRDKIGHWWNLPPDEGVDLAIIAKIPCADLQEIDQLWVKYSKGKFGFSVQREIYLECGKPQRGNYAAWTEFGKRVGWYRIDRWIMRQEVQFSSAAPRGNFPVTGVFNVLSCSDWSVALTGLAGLFARLEVCRGNGAKAKPFEQISYDPVTALTSEIQKGDTTTKFSYSGLRQRVLKTTARASAEPNRKQTLYVHGTNSYPLIETSDKGNIFYMYGLTGLLAMQEDDKLFFFCKDHLGSTRVVLNQSNAMEARFNYLPFGGVIAANSSPKEAMARFRYLYTGQEYDSETGLYNYRARIYDSDLGRFYSPDPAQEFFSPYVFVGNNPINRVDPSGTISLLGTRLLAGVISTGVYTVLGAGIGAAIGAIVGTAKHKTDLTEELRQGALWGAGAGASLGVLRIIAETVIIPKYRGFRGAANASHPVILYNATQTADILGVTYESGKVGAEMIAENQRIPRGLWNDHIISFQQLNTGRQFPASFNRRIITVAHGNPGSIETGLANVHDEFGFVDLIDRNKPLAGIDRIDLCVCNASQRPGQHQNSFAQKMRSYLDMLGSNITGWASERGVTPIGPVWNLGEIREGGSTVGELLYGIFPIPGFRPGVEMPTPTGNAVGNWMQF